MYLNEEKKKDPYLNVLLPSYIQLSTNMFLHKQ